MGLFFRIRIDQFKMRKTNYISYSLWGHLPIYTKGTIKNADLIPSIYPGWKMIVYHDGTVPEEILDELSNRNVELILINDQSIHPSFWRFYAADLEDCARVVFRDADSRVSVREFLAVEEWVADNTMLHVMRDHPFHQIPFGASKLGILAGMWGIKGGELQMVKLIEEFVLQKKAQEYGVDQAFLESIHEKFNNSKTVHDEFFEGQPFPTIRENFRFIGERIDESEQPLGDDWKHIMNYIKPIEKKGLFARVINFFK